MERQIGLRWANSPRHGLLRSGIAVLLASASAAPVYGLEPADVYKKVERSIWTVRTFDAGERRLAQGSAVAIAPGRLVTNCHVLAQAKSLVVRRDNVSYEAKLKHADPERDLCLLEVPNFTAPAVEIGSVKDVKVGARVYAIGNPRGLEATLSEGLISGLRGSDKEDGPDIIQTTAPISPGSSGGGLFTSEGVLIGITTLSRKEAQNINFAFPADWIAEVPARAEAALSARKSTAAMSSIASSAGGALTSPNRPASASLPAIGAAWKYRLVESRFRNAETLYTVRVSGVSGWHIHESISVDQAPDDLPVVRSISAEEIVLVERSVGRTFELMEFSPYFLIKRGDDTGSTGFNQPPRSADGWTLSGEKKGWEQITVGAGTFRAMKVQVLGRRLPLPSYGTYYGVEVNLTVWYAPEVNRIVKAERVMLSSFGNRAAVDTIDLVSYEPAR